MKDKEEVFGKKYRKVFIPAYVSFTKGREQKKRKKRYSGGSEVEGFEMPYI